MRGFIAVSMLALAATPLAAETTAPQAAGGTCFIQVSRLVTPAPQGIAELGGAIAALDDKLRPQVEEVNALKHRYDVLEMRLRQSQQTGDTISEEGERQAGNTAEVDRITREMQSVSAQLETKRAQLKTDYGEQMKVIVGPVQERVGQRAQAFGSSRGCGGLKMARNTDMAELQSAGARDVTGDFVTWYAANKS